MKKRKMVDFDIHIPKVDGDGTPEIIRTRIPVEVDAAGEEWMTEEGNDLIEEIKARHLGLLSPAEIKGLRKRLGLTQKEISELLQTGEKSWTRWESGRMRPSRLVNLVMQLMQSNKVSVKDLKELSTTHADLNAKLECQ